MEPLIKLTDANTDKSIYIKFSGILLVRESFKNPSNTSNGNNYGGTLGGSSAGSVIMTSVYYDEPGSTAILLGGNSPMLYVKEHITEIIAMMEGRDPRPAKVLYGKADR